MVEREDGERAGFDQDTDLHLGLQAQADLLFAFSEMFKQQSAALIQLADEETGHGETGD